MNGLEEEEFTFPQLRYGPKQIPHDLRILLYLNGSVQPRAKAQKSCKKDELGPPILDRLPLVRKLHDAVSACIAKGVSRASVDGQISSLRYMFQWADSQAQALTIETALHAYIEWTEFLLHRVRVRKDLENETAYGYATRVDRILSTAIEIPRGLLRHTRLYNSGPSLKGSFKSEKQNLADTFSFGHMLIDIADSLSIEAVKGTLPIRIKLRNVGEQLEWSGLSPPDNLKAFNGTTDPGNVRRSRLLRATRSMNPTIRNRSPVINLRVEAELLIFLAQTGMNLAQAHRLKRGHFTYRTENDNTFVYRVLKRRRGGEAEFRVYKGYRVFFERYLRWLDEAMPDCVDSRLFPFYYKADRPLEDSAPRFKAIRNRCKRWKVPWVGPQVLRRTRVNWLLRRTGDPALTAVEAQHTLPVLLSNYAKPHHQIAVSEITRFHKLLELKFTPPGPGSCASKKGPKQRTDTGAASTPLPDCVSPAGCLFCDYHRDIDSFAYVWSLASYRHLKVLELSRYRRPPNSATVHPAVAVIDRATLKLQAFAATSEPRSTWVEEAENRVREGRYCPSWDVFIQCLEGAT